MQIICPNEGCRLKPLSILRWGLSRSVASVNGMKRQRYKCTHCGSTFSQNRFSLEYRLKKNDLGLNYKIFLLCSFGVSNRRIARIHEVSESCVRSRLQRMAEWGFDYHTHMLTKLLQDEALCMDGLENFAGSQYDPNYINQIVGRDSLFIYDFNFSPMNRKGRMSPWQKLRLAEIEKELGRYDPSAIRKSTLSLVQRSYNRRICQKTPLALLSDEHFQYKRALLQLKAKCKIDHMTISSKACRNFQNILFPVNHADLLIRHHIGAFKRETISFSKTAARMCQRFMIFAVYKNYMAPQFTKTHVNRPHADKQSPAQYLGLTNKILQFREIFSSNTRMQCQGAAKAHQDWAYYSQNTMPHESLRSHKYKKRA